MIFFCSHFCSILGPAGTPKSTKNRLFADKGAPISEFLPIFAVFLQYRRSEALRGAIFGGQNLENRIIS